MIWLYYDDEVGGVFCVNWLYYDDEVGGVFCEIWFYYDDEVVYVCFV